jgi:glycosyltransferase involved in cell wall biosynthesis
VPLVSVLVASHNDARFLGAAIESVLTQTLRDLELIVVDDASTDETARLLGRLDDERVIVLTNEEQAGLARSLNRGLDRASGRYVARLDADDIAARERLQRQVDLLGTRSTLGIVGTGVRDLDEQGRLGARHVMPRGATELRWHALFSSPFFHPTVLVDRELLEAHGLRYDPSYLESEDYELWTRLLAFSDGDNLPEPLVFKRIHPAQASLRRGDLQTSFQREISLREIARIAPELTPAEAELARGVFNGHHSRGGGNAFVALLSAFEGVHGAEPGVRSAAVRALLRSGFLRYGLKLALGRPAPTRGRAPRVTVVSPEPTPYRSPLFDRIADRGDLQLTVLYAAESVAKRTWSVEPQHRHVGLRGARLPGAKLILRHDYPITLGLTRALARTRPDVIIVSGWSTFASQAAIAWCRARRVPYVLLVESHDLEARPPWRRAVKGAIVPRIVRGAASLLAVGSAARDSLVARGADPEKVRLFANTIDVDAWVGRADRFAATRPHHDDAVVLSVGRLVRDKGNDLLIRAIAEAGDPRLRLVLAGGGPERETLRELGARLGVDVSLTGDLSEEDLAAQYVAADVFALLSRHEPWGVVVNEAAASGLPLVLSASVGAAHDLLRDGENGFLVPAGDVHAAAVALRRVADDPALRRGMGARSRELVRGWGYEPSVENFAAAVRAATSR